MNGTITVGVGSLGQKPLLRYVDPKPFPVVDIGFGSLDGIPFYRNMKVLPYQAPAMFDTSDTAIARYGWYSWNPAIPNVPNPDRFLLQLSIRTNKEAFISFSTAQDNKAPMYEVILQRFDSGNNAVSLINKYSESNGGWTIDVSYVYDTAFRFSNTTTKNVWIYFDKGFITVGMNTPGSDILLSAFDNQFKPKFIGLSCNVEPVWFTNVAYVDPDLYFQNVTQKPSSYEGTVKLAAARHNRVTYRPILPAPEDGKDFLLTFKVRGIHDANFYLMDAAGQYYFIAFGAWGGWRSAVFRTGWFSWEMGYNNIGGKPYFNNKDWTQVWVYYKNGNLILGMGDINNDGVVVTAKDTSPLNIERFYLSNWNQVMEYSQMKFITNFVGDLNFPTPPTPNDFILSFTVQGARDALLTLSDRPGTYSDQNQFNFGGNGNQVAWARRGFNGHYLGGVINPAVISSIYPRSFWISINKGNVSMGAGNYPENPLVDVKDPFSPLTIKYLGLSSWDAPLIYTNVSFQCRNGSSCSSTLDTLNMTRPSYSNAHFFWMNVAFSRFGFLDKPVSKRAASPFFVRDGCPVTFPETGSFACGFTRYQYKVSDVDDSLLKQAVSISCKSHNETSYLVCNG